MLRRIGRYLRSGVLVDGVRVSSAEGTPQGGPLSPLPANIYLDALDRELERRGHCFRRSAADGNIYVRSEQAAEGTFRTTKAWIEKHLRRQVNESKSGIGRSGERQFLGVRRTREKQIEIALESRKKFKGKVGELWRSGQSRSREELRDAWKRYVQGWWGYFQLAEYRRPVGKLEGWIRRHIRKCFWLRGHGKKGRVAALGRLGVRDRMLQVASSRLGAWRLATTGVLHRALSNALLRRSGLLMPTDLAARS